MMWIIGLWMCAATASVFGGSAPLYGAGSGAVPGEYLVLLHSEQSKNIDERISEINIRMIQMRNNNEFKVLNRYEFRTFVAFHAEASEEAVLLLRTDPSVKLVQENPIVTLQDTSWQSEVDLGKCFNQSTGELNLWGLMRISSEKRPDYKTGAYFYDENGGADVTAYIIDSGIYVDHSDFEGRAVWGYTAQNLTGEGRVDLNGHGTHVAGTVGGNTFGVAKKVRLMAVKVFGESGSSHGSEVIEGIVWSCNHFADNRQRDKKYKGVVNMSLGSSVDPFTDTLVSTCIDAGLVFVVAAGNDDQDACNDSPARVSSSVTVGATDENDTLAFFSNYGSCVDILAPGVNIKSAFITGSTSWAIMSGTSMASPHVAGVVARYLSGHHYNPGPYYIKAWLLDMAAKDDIQIDATRLTTPNRMAYIPCAEEYCKADTCYNGGTCEERENGFTCVCMNGYKGNYCETEIIAVETSYDDTTVVALLSVTLSLVCLLFLAVVIALVWKHFKPSLAKSTEEPYRRQTDVASIT